MAVGRQNLVGGNTLSFQSALDNNTLDRRGQQSNNNLRPSTNQNGRKQAGMRQSVVLNQKAGLQNVYNDQEQHMTGKKINKRTFSQKQNDQTVETISSLNQRQNRNTLFIGGNGLNQPLGQQFAYMA